MTAIQPTNPLFANTTTLSLGCLIQQFFDDIHWHLNLLSQQNNNNLCKNMAKWWRGNDYIGP